MDKFRFLVALIFAAVLMMDMHRWTIEDRLWAAVAATVGFLAITGYKLHEARKSAATVSKVSSETVFTRFMDLIGDVTTASFLALMFSIVYFGVRTGYIHPIKEASGQLHDFSKDLLAEMFYAAFVGVVAFTTAIIAKMAVTLTRFDRLEDQNEKLEKSAGDISENTKSLADSSEKIQNTLREVSGLNEKLEKSAGDISENTKSLASSSEKIQNTLREVSVLTVIRDSSGAIQRLLKVNHDMDLQINPEGKMIPRSNVFAPFLWQTWNSTLASLGHMGDYLGSWATDEFKSGKKRLCDKGWQSLRRANSSLWRWLPMWLDMIEC